MDTAELLKRVRKVEIKTRSLSRHIFSGEYHSAFKGRGMSFSEVRNYQYGDEVRDIDWNVTARTGEPHIKVFEEERELTLMLLVDVSPSVFFGTGQFWKNEWMAEIAAVLGFSALQNNDKVGLILFTDQVELYIPPKKGRQHLLRIIRELLYYTPVGKKTDVNVPIRYMTLVMKKRCIAFVLSDFQSPSFVDSLRLASRRHDITGINIYDAAEHQIPTAGLMKVRHPETGHVRVIDTADPALHMFLQRKFEKSQDEFLSQCRLAGCDTMTLEAGQNYVPAFHRFFKSRTSA